MNIYILLVAVILVLNMQRKRKKISDKTFSIIVCVLLILVAGLRANFVGADTHVYYQSFCEKTNYTLAQVIALDKRDFGYYILEWFVSNYLHEFVFMTLIVACVFYIPLSLFIYEYSRDLGMSYLVLLAFTFVQFSMTGMRQTLAFGFALLFIREILKEKPKYILAIAWILIGMSMHKSCIVCFVYLLIKIVKNSRWLAVCTLGLTVVFFQFRARIASIAIILFQEIGFDNYDKYVSGGGLTTYLMYVLLLFWGLFLTYKEKQNTGRMAMPNLYLVILGLATALQGLVYHNSIFFRIVWYFSVFLAIYIPEIVTTSRFNKRDGSIINLVLYAGLLYMYFGITIGSANVLPYQFFWQG